MRRQVELQCCKYFSRIEAGDFMRILSGRSDLDTLADGEARDPVISAAFKAVVVLSKRQVGSTPTLFRHRAVSSHRFVADSASTDSRYPLLY